MNAGEAVAAGNTLCRAILEPVRQGGEQKGKRESSETLYGKAGRNWHGKDHEDAASDGREA